MVLVAALAVPTVVRAEPIPESLPPPAEVEVEWHAPPSCPDEDQLRARIEALLSGPPRGEGTVHVVGRVEAHDQVLRLTLSTDFRRKIEHRELVAASCDELAEATAIVLAVALEPGLAGSLSVMPTIPDLAVPEPDSTRGVKTEPGPPAEAGVRVEGEPPVGPDEGDPLALAPTTPPAGDDEGASSDRDDARRPPRPPVHVRVAAAAEIGALPGLTAGPRLALGLRWKHARIELGGVYLAPRLDAPNGAGALYQAGMIAMRGCGSPWAGKVEFPLCGGWESGAVRGATRGFEPPRTRHAPWLGPLVSAGVARRWGRVGVWSALEAVVPVFSGEFVFAGQVEFRRLPVSGRVAIGLEIILP